ncbi:transposase [Streptomyces sp. NPDC001443]
MSDRSGAGTLRCRWRLYGDRLCPVDWTHPHPASQYTLRARVEDTINQALDVTDLRRAHYRGLPKTSLQHAYSATAINVIRLDAHWTGQSRHPRNSRLTWLSHQLAA